MADGARERGARISLNSLKRFSRYTSLSFSLCLCASQTSEALFSVDKNATLKLSVRAKRLGDQVAGARQFDSDDGLFLGFAHVGLYIYVETGTSLT